MRQHEIDVAEIGNIAKAISNQAELLSYFRQLKYDEDKPKVFMEELLAKRNIKYEDHNLHREWTDIDLHHVKQMWGSTACGWGGMGGAAMTESYSTVLINKGLKIAFVYWNGTLAYVVHADDEFMERMGKRIGRVPGLNEVKKALNVIYINENRR